MLVYMSADGSDDDMASTDTYIYAYTISVNLTVSLLAVYH